MCTDDLMNRRSLGRHKIYGKELILTICGTLLVIVMPTHMSHEGVVAWM